jgi:hypothetical protein
MKTYRRTTLFSLYPVVDFSFSAQGTIYTLLNRKAGQRRDKYTFTLLKKGTRSKVKRYFTFEDLHRTFVFLRDNPRTSIQPKTSICFTYNCM